MRTVLDANVLAPGFLGRTSASARLIDLWRRQVYELVVSEHLLAELARAYTDPYFRRRITPERIARVSGFLRQRAIVTELTVTVSGVATQPKDDLVLATGLGAGATFLVTRDRQLLKLGGYRGLRVVSPGQFLTLLEHEG